VQDRSQHDHAQAAAEMPAGLAHGYDLVGAQFIGDGAQHVFGLLAQVSRANVLLKTRVTAWVDHAAIVLPAVGGGNEGRAKPGCGERRIDAGSRGRRPRSRAVRSAKAKARTSRASSGATPWGRVVLPDHDLVVGVADHGVAGLA